MSRPSGRPFVNRHFTRALLRVLTAVGGLSFCLAALYWIKLHSTPQNGVQLVLQVRTDDAVGAETDRAVDEIRQRLGPGNLSFAELSRLDYRQFQIRFRFFDAGRDRDLRSLTVKYLPNWDLITKAGDHQSAHVFRLLPKYEKHLRYAAVDQTMEVIRARLDNLRIDEARVSRYGSPDEFQILVQLPTMDDPRRAKALVQGTGKLELRLVVAGPFPTRQAANEHYGDSRDTVETLPSREAPAGSQIWYVVQRSAMASGRDFKDVHVSRDDSGHPAISLSLKPEAGERLGNITGSNRGKFLAIVLDGRIQSAPRITQRVTDSIINTGGSAGFRAKDAEDLALALNSGLLPATVQFVREEVGGTSLAPDSLPAVIALAASASVVFIALCLTRRLT
jgi:preprotein translocase subunit SecD